MKKRVLFILSVLCVMLYVPNVMAKGIIGCETILPNIEIEAKIVNVTSTIITVIQVVVPIILVIFGMIDLTKAVIASKEDEIKKGRQTFIKRLFAAVIVFFTISVVRLLISFVSGDKEGFWECVDCFLSGANETTGVCNGSESDATTTPETNS